jgi:hypothetical protein
MKKTHITNIVFIIVFFTSCSVTIPTQSNLSEQTLLLAKNRDIKADYTLISRIPDGDIQFIEILKNGNRISRKGYKYANETAFKSMWVSYFSNKFNDYSKASMKIEVVLMNLNLYQYNLTSVARAALFGNVQMNNEAVSELYVKIEFSGNSFEKNITTKVSEYNESQTNTVNGVVYSYNTFNPTHQKARLLENCLNRSIIQFENFIKSVESKTE